MDELPKGTVTLLFCDIEGSTRLLQQLGAQYSELLNTCRRLQRTAFQEHHGCEVDTQGDSDGSGEEAFLNSQTKETRSNTSHARDAFSSSVELAETTHAAGWP